MFYLHCSKQLLDRVSSGVNEPAGKGDNILGNWYAKAIFSKPQVALFVNERTLLPVLMPLAPASNSGLRNCTGNSGLWISTQSA